MPTTQIDPWIRVSFEKLKGPNAFRPLHLLVFGQGLSSRARGQSLLCPSVPVICNTTKPSVWRAKCVDGPGKGSARSPALLKRIIIVHRFVRACLCCLPTDYTDPAPRGAGIQVPGSLRVGISPSFLTPPPPQP